MTPQGTDDVVLKFVLDTRAFTRAMAVLGRDLRHVGRNAGRSRHHRYERPDRARVHAAYRTRQIARRRRNRR